MFAEDHWNFERTKERTRHKEAKNWLTLLLGAPLTGFPSRTRTHTYTERHTCGVECIHPVPHGAFVALFCILFTLAVAVSLPGAAPAAEDRDEAVGCDYCSSNCEKQICTNLNPASAKKSVSCVCLRTPRDLQGFFVSFASFLIRLRCVLTFPCHIERSRILYQPHHHQETLSPRNDMMMTAQT